MVPMDWRLRGYRADFSNRVTVFWPCSERGFCAVEVGSRAGEKGAEGQALLSPRPLDVGETSASSAALDSIAVRRIAEYFVLLSA